jgi:hypothetical protein
MKCAPKLSCASFRRDKGREPRTMFRRPRRGPMRRSSKRARKAAFARDPSSTMAEPSSVTTMGSISSRWGNARGSGGSRQAAIVWRLIPQRRDCTPRRRSATRRDRGRDRCLFVTEGRSLPLRANVRVRYRHHGALANVTATPAGARVRFAERSAPSPGGRLPCFTKMSGWSVAVGSSRPVQARIALRSLT